MNSSHDFYITGGNIPENADCYVQRRADSDLYNALKNGEFCYVLTSRQMGKSSLMVRAARQLREDGAAVVVIELTSIGMNLTPDQWYDGLMVSLGRQLNLEDELDDFWDDHQSLGPLQRWLEAIYQVVMKHYQGPVVIFIDEIDVTRSLPFSTDEFFAAIRQCYNARTEDPEFNRLTFCLIGVATPTDLVQDVRLTPFNIGTRIELEDFTENEAALLAQGLGKDEKQAKALLKRILYWTGGHPYLTQRLCKAVAEDMYIASPTSVDRICNTIFLSTRSRESDHNLQFVRDRMLRDKEEDKATLLDVYRQVRERKKIKDDDTNPIIAILRLSGLVRVLENYLWVRNRIYFRAFDKDWIDANMPDAEKQRQKAAYRRGVMRTAVVAAMIIAFICGGILWYWDGYVREHVAYYNTFAKRFGVMQGVGKLTPQQVRGRAVSLKFIQKGRYNPVWKVQVVNSSGELNPRHGVGTYFHIPTPTEQLFQPLRECQWEFVLDSTGKIVYEKAYNKYGQIVWGLVYSPPLKGHPTRAHFVGPNGFPQPQIKSAAEFVEFKYSEKGDEIYRRYTDRNGNPQIGLDKAFGQKRIFDERGLTLKNISLDKNGNSMNDEAGNATASCIYDELGNIIQMIALDASDKPILLKDGYHKFTAKYDERGNQIEWAYFDTEGKPTLHKDVNHKFTVKYDERGNQIELAYFDTNGKPASHKDGYHKFTAKYDEWGNQMEWAHFDTDGKPTLHKNGFHKFTAKYDEWGNQIEWAFFNTKRNPTLNKDGFYKINAKYDERGNRIEEAYFDTDGKPTLNKDSFHRFTAKYDDRGNSIEETYFDTDGKPTSHKDGFHKIEKKYDERGNQIEWACFNTQDKPTLHKDGYHKGTAKYDERGNQIEWACFDTEGKPTLHKDGYHKIEKKYDERGNQIEEAYLDTNDKPILQDNFHKFTAEYDERGNLTKWACFDAEGKPTSHKDGFHKFTAKYDERGNQIEIAHFDTDSKAILYKNGVHKASYKYDERGNLTEGACFDIQGKPTSHKDGYHKSVFKYDERGNRIEEFFFDTKGKPTSHRLLAKYDERGNQVEVAYFDTQNKPIIRNDLGFHKFMWKYDERGNKTEEAYFDEDGKPALNKNGYHKFTAKYKYDDRGNQIEEAYFDTDGNPTLHKDGFHKFTAKYDERGILVEETYFAGLQKVTFKYDELGNPIEENYFDVNGQPLETEIVVTSVLPDSQGEKLGIKPGDIFIQYDDKPISDMYRFIAQRDTEPPDGPAKELQVFRDGKVLKFMISPGKIGAVVENRVKTSTPTP